MEFFPRLAGQRLHVLHGSPQVFQGHPQAPLAEPEGFEADRHRAHRCFDPFRCQRGEEIQQPVGVLETIWRTPIGLRDVLLHPGSVEVAVRKSIDREHVAVMPLEPSAKGRKGTGFGELTRGGVTEAEADGIRPIRRDLLPYG